MTNQPLRPMARYAARTSCGSWLMRPATARARNAPTAPSQPTENVMWAVSMNLRSAGARVIGEGS